MCPPSQSGHHTHKAADARRKNPVLPRRPTRGHPGGGDSALHRAAIGRSGSRARCSRGTAGRPGRHSVSPAAEFMNGDDAERAYYAWRTIVLRRQSTDLDERCEALLHDCWHAAVRWGRKDGFSLSAGLRGAVDALENTAALL